MKHKLAATAALGMIAGVTGTYAVFSMLPTKLEYRTTVKTVEVPREVVRETVVTRDVPALNEGPGTRYNCELSAGTFQDGQCTCILEMNQTQEQMYDRTTGFCQSTHGGPIGPAGWSYSGLPHGDYGYFLTVALYHCQRSGGSVSGSACICPEGSTYSKETGLCSSSQ